MMRRLLSLFFALAFILPCHAQTDRKEVRAGNRRFAREKFKEAEIDYRKAALKDSCSVAAWYNLASSLFRQEDWDGASPALDKTGSTDPGVAFNRGDVAMKKQDWKTAVDAFREALLQTPDDMDAKENYIYAKKKLEEQQNQQDQNQDQQNQNQDQQDQNRDQQNQNQDQQDQNQDQQDQNRDQQNQPQDQPRDSRMSPQQAQQMLRAIQAKEKETQEKVNQEKAEALKSRQREKNW